jgi:hypothetical protein
LSLKHAVADNSGSQSEGQMGVVLPETEVFYFAKFVQSTGGYKPPVPIRETPLVSHRRALRTAFRHDARQQSKLCAHNRPALREIRARFYGSRRSAIELPGGVNDSSCHEKVDYSCFSALCSGDGAGFLRQRFRR